MSRTFALCIRLLPPKLERSVRIAYLLCRVADTIEDEEGLPLEEKRELLRQFGDAVSRAASLTPAGAIVPLLRTAFPETGTAEHNLCYHADRVLREFSRLDHDEREAIRPWVVEMCSGMAVFSREPATDGRLPSLERMEDLDRYCYYVAGTVGHLLTDLFGLRLADRHRRYLPELQRYATSFGLGLQLTNIIKDAARDHRRGWSFIPRELCEREGIDVAGLFGPDHAEASRRVFATLISKARGHLDDALHYTTTLPASQYRMRLFCLTSLFFAVRTLRLAAGDGKTETDRLVRGDVIKISRAEVYRIVAGTAAVASSNTLVGWYFKRLGRPGAMPAPTPARRAEG